MIFTPQEKLDIRITLAWQDAGFDLEKAMRRAVLRRVRYLRERKAERKKVHAKAQEMREAA